VNIKQRNDRLQLTLLFTVTNVAIYCLAKPAQAQILVSADPNPQDNFMREQLNSSGSNTSAPLQNINSDWSQPIGWLFGVMFVILGSIVAWSKYVKKP
jgi:hypothetical protein